jgi:RNA polymerase sigma-70 factor (ECF subfamily)
MDGATVGGNEDLRRRRFTRLTAEHRPTLYAIALKLCHRERAIADDLVQDAYERAWKNLESLQDDSKVRAWLVRILQNCWFDICRKHAPDVLMAEVPEIRMEADKPSAWERITVDDFHGAIDQLEEPYRSVVIMHDVDHLTNSAIAQQLAIPYATVATRLHRAHRQLKDLLRGKLEAEEER